MAEHHFRKRKAGSNDNGQNSEEVLAVLMEWMYGEDEIERMVDFILFLC